MLVFIDESGHPHPKDGAPHPTVVAACIRERDVRGISAQLYGLKRRLTGQPEAELKAHGLITRGTFRRRPEKKDLVEAFFDLGRNLPVTLFAIVMERPSREPTDAPSHLPNQFRYLLQRVPTWRNRKTT